MTSPAGVIDVHAHYFDIAYLTLLEKHGVPDSTTGQGRRVAARDRDDDLKRRLMAMDRAGVRVQILSASNCAPALGDAVAAARAARLINETYAGITHGRGRRFAFFASLPLPHVEEALAETAYALDAIGAVGLALTTSVAGRSLADPAFDAVYSEFDRRGAVVFVHPAGCACDSPMIEASGMTWALGAPVEDTLCMLDLMRAGILRRYPGIRWIVPHLGGVFPFLLERLDRTAQRTMPNEALPSKQARSVFVDCTGAAESTLRLAGDVYGWDRILFGSDYPYYPDAEHDAAVAVLDPARWSSIDITAVRTSNALGLFPRLLEPHGDAHAVR